MDPTPAFITSGAWKQYVDDNHTVVTLPLPDSWAVLDAPGPVEAAATATYRHLVTIYVPPASSPDAQLQFLGVERVLASVARTE